MYRFDTPASPISDSVPSAYSPAVLRIAPETPRPSFLERPHPLLLSVSVVLVVVVALALLLALATIQLYPGS
ncbi:MAG TPA: hypothetical protein VMR75_00255 [Candidatus Saccharimonadales bacterium]|nr:hypothetical protein [Candidatus Saccharimonadales bacterium]